MKRPNLSAFRPLAKAPTAPAAQTLRLEYVAALEIHVASLEALNAGMVERITSLQTAFDHVSESALRLTHETEIAVSSIGSSNSRAWRKNSANIQELLAGIDHPDSRALRRELRDALLQMKAYSDRTADGFAEEASSSLISQIEAILPTDIDVEAEQCSTYGAGQIHEER